MWIKTQQGNLVNTDNLTLIFKKEYYENNKKAGYKVMASTDIFAVGSDGKLVYNDILLGKFPNAALAQGYIEDILTRIEGGKKNVG